VVKLDCSELIVEKAQVSKKVLSYYYGRRMRYTGAEDAYQRRYTKYCDIEDDLKKYTFYAIEGRTMSVKQIEASLHGDQLTTDDKTDLQYLVANKTYLQALEDFYTSPVYRRVQFMRFVSKQKRDSYFLKKFKSNFPNPANTVIFWGAGYKQQRTSSGNQPTNSAEYFKELLLKVGYKIFEVGEYFTS
jgi:hypothetical protein